MKVIYYVDQLKKMVSVNKSIIRFLMVIILLMIVIPILNHYIYINMPDDRGITEKQKMMEIQIMKSKFEISKLILNNNQMNDNKFPAKYMLCFTFPGFFTYGGVEKWFWGLKDVFFSSSFTIHAIKVIDSWGPEIPQIFESMGILFNPSFFQMQVECDVNIMTGSHPMKRLSEHELQLLVIHGGFGCEWTTNYAKHYRHYNKVVGVSLDSNKYLGDDKDKSTFIPSLVAYDASNCLNVPPCEKAILYLGRISSEKRPELFCDLINELPNDYCGWMVGPYYFDASIPKNCGSRVKVEGPSKNPQCLIRKSYIVVNTSPKEGGPIVAIETWMNNKPYMMFKTGLGELMSADDTFDTDDSKSMSVEIINLNLENNVRNNGLILSKYFDREKIMNDWSHVLLSTLRSSKSVKPIHIDMAVGGYVQNHGKSRTLFCYKYCIFENTIKYWQSSVDSEIHFEFIVESDYGTKSIKIEVGSKSKWEIVMYEIKSKLSNVSVKIPEPSIEQYWRITMSETIITLYSISIH